MNASSPIISIITPMYNCERHIPSLVKTLKEQSFQSWECILIDDGSKDGTYQFAINYTLSDPRFIVISQDNEGPSAARRNGFMNSKGNFIQFLDADDTLHPQKLEKCLSVITDSSFGSYSHFNFIKPPSNESFIEPWRRSRLDENSFLDLICNWEKELIIPIHSFLFKREIVEEFFSIPGKFQTHEDWDMHLYFARKGYHFIYIPDALVYYHLEPDSNSRKNLTVSKKDTLNVLAKYYDLNPRFRKKITLRYFQFIAQFIAQTFKGHSFNWSILINNKMPKFHRVFAIIFTPYFLFTKLLEQKK